MCIRDRAEIQLADSLPEWGDPTPEMLGGTPIRIVLEVPDVDAFAQRAVNAGAKILIPVADQFYGARSGRLEDPYGHVWIVSTHVKDVPFEEMQRIFSDMMKQPAAQSVEEPVRIGPIRKGFRSITPYLILENANAFMNFLSAAFGGEEKFRMPEPEGKIMHAEASVAGSMIEFADANAEFPPMPTALHFYVAKVCLLYTSRCV